MSERDFRPDQVRAGDLIAGKYRVERVHKRGALGVTVEALHTQLGQRVAVRVLAADPAAYPEAARRFLRGARLAVQFQNEHTARIMDVGTLESGTPYVVAELLPGSDLQRVLRVREWLPAPEAVDYVLQACQALSEAHAHGVVHRNLKPTNLFLTRRDGARRLVVLDFGVSDDPLSDAAINLGGIGGAATALAYLAPEQIRDPGSVDARADLWALGAVLHEMLTGCALYGVADGSRSVGDDRGGSARPSVEFAPRDPRRVGVGGAALLEQGPRGTLRKRRSPGWRAETVCLDLRTRSSRAFEPTVNATSAKLLATAVAGASHSRDRSRAVGTEARRRAFARAAHESSLRRVGAYRFGFGCSRWAGCVCRYSRHGGHDGCGGRLASGGSGPVAGPTGTCRAPQRCRAARRAADSQTGSCAAHVRGRSRHARSGRASLSSCAGRAGRTAFAGSPSDAESFQLRPRRRRRGQARTSAEGARRGPLR